MSVCPVPYFTMIRSKNISFDYRLQLVLHARTHGIKPTARAFQCSVNTVRLWLRRFNEQGLSGLKNLSRAPLSCPHKLSSEAERIILAYRDKTPSFGARHLKYEFDLPWGVNSIARVISQNRPTRKRKKKHKRKNDLRAIKAAYKPFTRFQTDTKYLTDIPKYWTPMNSLNLPRFQYTIRELSLGAQFVSYGSEISATYAALTNKRLLLHLEKHGIDLSKVIIQSDNGSEFDGQSSNLNNHGFRHMVEDGFKAKHKRIFPGHKNAQADVETVHNLIEDEFFDIESFLDRNNFFDKVTTYQHYFNFARKNGSRGYKSPLDLMQEKASYLNASIFYLPPLDLDAYLLALGGQDLPSLADGKP